jgi:hypothetical protein
MTAPMVLDGPINCLAFEAYVTEVLVPTLKPDHVVVMDNLAAHKRAEVATAQVWPARTRVRRRWSEPRALSSDGESPGGI